MPKLKLRPGTPLGEFNAQEAEIAGLKAENESLTRLNEYQNEYIRQLKKDIIQARIQAELMRAEYIRDTQTPRCDVRKFPWEVTDDA